MKSIVTLCATLLVSSYVASAVDVRFLAWDEAVAARNVAVSADGKTTEIKNLHPLQRTEAIATSTAEGSVTVRSLDKKTEDGKPLDLAVKVDTTMTKPLILLLPDEKAPSGLRGFAIEDDSTSFTWGTFRILNATGKVLNMALGSERKQLPAGWLPVDLKPGGDKPIPVWLATADAPKNPLYTSVWKPEADVRRLVIVVPGSDPRLGPISLKVIPEDRRTLATALNP